MSDVSSTRRKLGLAAIATGALVALPLTASVTYAQDEAPAAEAEPQRVIRFELQREGEEVAEAAAGASDESGEPQIRRRMIIRRNSAEDVSEVGANLPEASTDGPHPTRQMVIIRHGASPEDRLHASARAFEDGCADDEQEIRSQNADGSSITLICRKAPAQAAASAIRSAQRAITNNEQLPVEDRERIVRELEAEIEALEALEISFAPATPDAPFMVQVNAIRVSVGPFAGEQALFVIPAAVVRPAVPVVPKVPKSARST